MVAPRKTKMLGALLLLGTAALYAPFVDHPFLLDDAVQIYENPAVTRGAPIAAYFLDRDTTSSRPDYNTRIYRPLRNLGFRAIAAATGRSAGGLRPLAFGVTNLVLYLACVALVLVLARTLVGESAALLASALFAAAPVHVEAVLYASALGDLLSATCELAALLAAVAAVAVNTADADADADADGGPGADGRGGDPGGRRAFALAAASLILAALAMAAKEMAVTGVAVLALWLWVRRALWSRRGLALVGAHGVLALAYLALRTHVLGRVGQEAVTARTLGAGLREAPWLLVHYVRLTLMPLGHSAAYVVAPPSWGQLALALALIVAAALLAWRTRNAAVRLGLGWFALSLLPVLHLVPLWADLADRFALVPSVGLALALAGALDRAFASGRSHPSHPSHPSRHPHFARPVRVVGLAVLALYGVGSALEARSWSSDAALWSHAAEMAPESPLAQSNLGVVRIGQGQPDEALVAFDRAIALGRGGAEVFYRRATALAALGRNREARDAVRQALADEPASGRAYALLADLEGQLGDLDAASRDLARAQALAPDHPSTALARAALAERAGRNAEAAAIYVDLAARHPREARFHFLAARALLATGETGDRARAAVEARICLTIEPGQAQCEALLPGDQVKP